MIPEVQHMPALRRFVIEVDGHIAHVEYALRDGVMVVTRTIVPVAIGGRGIAARLVQAAVDHARSAGLKVSPQCSYAEAWMRRHPQYDDLRT